MDKVALRPDYDDAHADLEIHYPKKSEVRRTRATLSAILQERVSLTYQLTIKLISGSADAWAYFKLDCPHMICPNVILHDE